MPNRLSKLFSAADKEKEALAVTERNVSSSASTSDAPPSYEQQESYDPENDLPPPDTTTGFSNLRISSSREGFPSKEECIAHLKLLECFYRLKKSIAAQDDLFGIKDELVTGQNILRNDRTSELLAKLGEKRWAIYVQQAVDRFEAWWEAIVPESRMADRTRLEAEGKEGELCTPSAIKDLILDDPPLPPVDVLMVWHAFQLNPRCYLEDCTRQGKLDLWYSSFPWEAVASSINSETFAYEATAAAQASFTETTGMMWNSVADVNTRETECPTCLTRNAVPWTTCTWLSVPTGLEDQNVLETNIHNMLSYGSGYCDKDLRHSCKTCFRDITHNRLRIGQFARDAELLQDNDTPMKGTILGLQGIPWKAHGLKDTTTDAINKVPNQMIKLGKYSTFDVLELRKLSFFSDIRDRIEAAIKDKKYMREVRGSLSYTLQRTERIAVRKMMSRYWENSSPLALDLLGAVIRQGSFIEKMHGIDWLHSPALPSTMSRLVRKYQNFVLLMAQNPTRMAVPTLDVDLAWHTHQLNPSRYMEYTVKLCKQFVDHDDKVAETQLNDSFTWTSKAYQKLTGQAYSECTCWYCEAVRESHTSATSRLFNTSSTQNSHYLATHEVSQDPSKSVHISTHNAVRPSDDPTYSTHAQKHAKELEKQYQKACARARKQGKKEPKRNDYYYSDAYGYPVYLPAYSPYVGFVPYGNAGYYPVAPGCMAIGVGAAGNCCSGTCGGGVAAGSCAGAGACAGGGGGGGGGGGCDGGGGGGGGGGGCGGGGGGC